MDSLNDFFRDRNNADPSQVYAVDHNSGVVLLNDAPPPRRADRRRHHPRRFTVQTIGPREAERAVIEHRRLVDRVLLRILVRLKRNDPAFQLFLDATHAQIQAAHEFYRLRASEEESLRWRALPPPPPDHGQAPARKITKSDAEAAR
jgi:hypothetical protein